jgi:hypothetical protein
LRASLPAVERLVASRSTESATSRHRVRKKHALRSEIDDLLHIPSISFLPILLLADIANRGEVVNDSLEHDSLEQGAVNVSPLTVVVSGSVVVARISLPSSAIAITPSRPFPRTPPAYIRYSPARSAKTAEAFTQRGPERLRRTYAPVPAPTAPPSSVIIDPFSS